MTTSSRRSLFLTDRAGGAGIGMLVAAFAIAWLGGPGTVRAEDELPSAEQVMAKYIEAIGGEAALGKLHNRLTKGVFEGAGLASPMTFTAYTAEPAKRHVLMESESTGRIEEGTDGTVAWSSDSIAGSRLLEGTERDQAVQRAFFHQDLKWRERFDKVECVGVESVDGKPCYKLVATPAEGKPETWYFDQQSYLRIKSVSIRETQRGDLPIEYVASDFRKVDGVLQPYKLLQKMATREMVITIESIEHNVDLPAGLFLPDEIKTLIELEKEMAEAEAAEAAEAAEEAEEAQEAEQPE
ncbi:MAG TPA: hypothetical protein VM243_13490 [Phycisphaerae bacterium]|nr:hypothetical protein [Phycisphaerae bacterium]